jgi:hypothetical protein
MTVQAIQKQLMKLDAKDRAKIAGILLSSLDDLSDAENESLWASESLKRHHDILKGKAKTKSASAVFRKLRSKIR